MARSAGFKINRQTAEYVARTLQQNLDTETMSNVVFDLRAIMGKYQHHDDILRDLQEIQAQAQALAQSQGEVEQPAPENDD